MSSGIIAAVCFSEKALAQLNPLRTSYYSNEYFINPAAAGSGTGLQLFGAISKQFTNIPGSPRIQAFSADYGFSNRVGTGLLVINETAGLFQQMKIAGTYAYHLPLGNDNQHVDFGLSVSIMKERIDFDQLEGDRGDLDLVDLNQRPVFVDFDYGMTYRNNSFRVQLAVPNIRRVLIEKNMRDFADYTLLFAAASYRFNTGMGAVEPKVAYRNVRNYKDLLDLGLGFQFRNLTSNQLSLYGIYHNTKCATVGFELSFNSDLSFTGLYTTSPADFGYHSKGSFELGVGARLASRLGNRQSGTDQ